MYQPLPVSFPSRLFKYVPPPETPTWPRSSSADTDEEQSSVQPRAIRLRFGRGGRLLVDRRHVTPRLPLMRKQKPQSPFAADNMVVDEEHDEDKYRVLRLAERWKYDADDYPSVGPQGSDEQDRVLIDDYEPK